MRSRARVLEAIGVLAVLAVGCDGPPVAFDSGTPSDAGPCATWAAPVSQAGGATWWQPCAGTSACVNSVCLSSSTGGAAQTFCTISCGAQQCGHGLDPPASCVDGVCVPACGAGSGASCPAGFACVTSDAGRQYCAPVACP